MGLKVVIYSINGDVVKPPIKVNFIHYTYRAHDTMGDTTKARLKWG